MVALMAETKAAMKAEMMVARLAAS
jgi:hypothetical protein